MSAPKFHAEIPTGGRTSDRQSDDLELDLTPADDVTRAVSLMITNAMQDSGAEDEFIGHLDAVEFIIITSPERCKKVSENCAIRLQPSIQYFYPAVDRQRVKDLPEVERLTVQVTSLSSRDGNIPDIAAVFFDKLLRLYEHRRSRSTGRRRGPCRAPAFRP